MASQVATHKNLKDRFLILDYQNGRPCPTHGKMENDLTDAFEKGQVIVFDNLNFHDLSYFFSQSGKWYPDWVPPVFSNGIQKPVVSDHVLRDYYEDDEKIKKFQNQVRELESSWMKMQSEFFPQYKWELNEFSYRFNHMSLGFMHLDVPDKSYEEHQFRWFVNLDKKPRILTIGPTIFELAYQYWDEMRLWELKNLQPHEFIGELRKRVLDETIYREREMPRHYLTLDPGSLWLAHSSYVSHGLVYGRKTACLEGHIRPSSLRSPTRHFNSLLRELQRHGRQTEEALERSLANKGTLAGRLLKPLMQWRSYGG